MLLCTEAQQSRRQFVALTVRATSAAAAPANDLNETAAQLIELENFIISCCELFILRGLRAEGLSRSFTESGGSLLIIQEAVHRLPGVILILSLWRHIVGADLLPPSNSPPIGLERL